MLVLFRALPVVVLAFATVGVAEVSERGSAELKELYAGAKVLHSRGLHRRAERLLLKVLRKDPKYPGAAKLLSKVKTEIGREEARAAAARQKRELAASKAKEEEERKRVSEEAEARRRIEAALAGVAGRVPRAASKPSAAATGPRSGGMGEGEAPPAEGTAERGEGRGEASTAVSRLTGKTYRKRLREARKQVDWAEGMLALGKAGKAVRILDGVGPERDGIRSYWTLRSRAEEQVLKRAVLLLSQEKKVAQAPNDDDARFVLGHGYLERDCYADAAEQYRAVIALRPEDADAYVNLGYALRMSRDFKGAEQAFRKVIQLRPGWAGGYNHLAFMFAEAKQNLGEAKGLADKALGLSPGDADILDTVAHILYLNGQYRQAHNYSSEAVKKSEMEDLHYRHGLVLAKVGKNSDARKCLERVRKQNGEYAKLAQEALDVLAND